MSDYIIYYAESNLVCIIIFGIILVHDLFNVDRQEKQIKYDHALIAFMAYFVSDTLWAMVIEGIIPKNEITVAITNFLNYIFMAWITYAWLNYVMAVEQTPNRNRIKNRYALISPFLVSTAGLILVYIFGRELLFDDNLTPRTLYNLFLITVPAINIVAIMFYAFRKAKSEPNPLEKRRHSYVGLLPLLVVAGGLVQVVLLPRTPVFCFSCTIIMLIFHIQSMQTAISVDPLTGLNNRGQLMRFISQKNNTSASEKRTFVVMMDLNSFKAINDVYGHEEGDRALTIVADSLKKAAKENSITQFLGRYGGDEFIMILQSESEGLINNMIEDLRRGIVCECEKSNTPYILTIGAGCDELMGENDTFKSCIMRADRKLYLDKEYLKLNGKSTVVRRKAAG